MRKQDFYYDLPEELIAKAPTEKRRDSRLLCLNGDTGEICHKHFGDILENVAPGDLMVFNDTRVIPARVFGQKTTGGKVEILVERVLDERTILAHVRSSKSPRAGAQLLLEDGTGVEVLRREDTLFVLQFAEGVAALEILNNIGHMPLPPYIDRPDEDADRERYQTVYSHKPGAVAAPTAGLHFDDDLLAQLKAKGVQVAFVTLHVGAGTFQPVRADNIYEHRMHSEFMEVSQDVCDLVLATKAQGKRVIAVGTTSVRCLESAAQDGAIQPYQGDTDIFIFPGYDFQVVDALVTNFHLPESTLMMLVSAFSGYTHIMNAYREAITEKYRFFSYGDAMFLSKNTSAETSLPEMTETENNEI